jgi:hypothetical protein
MDPTAITTEHAIDLLVGEGDSYYHCRIKRILVEAGLTLWRLACRVIGSTAGFIGIAKAVASGRYRPIDSEVAFCYPTAMSQPVKVSDTLILDARLTGEVAERSIAGQIEFWARLGRAIEPLLRGDQVLALRRSGDAKALSECLQSVDSPEGRQRVAEHLKTRPFPHYEPAGSSGLLVRIEANGKRAIGRFVNREFQAVKKAKR